MTKKETTFLIPQDTIALIVFCHFLKTDLIGIWTQYVNQCCHQSILSKKDFEIPRNLPHLIPRFWDVMSVGVVLSTHAQTKISFWVRSNITILSYGPRAKNMLFLGDFWCKSCVLALSGSHNMKQNLNKILFYFTRTPTTMFYFSFISHMRATLHDDRVSNKLRISLSRHRRNWPKSQLQITTILIILT